MDGDNGVSIENGIHEGKGRCKNILLMQQTCDGSAMVVVNQSGRQATYNDGVSIGIVKAVGLLLQRWRQHPQEQQEVMCLRQGTYVGGDGKEIGQ
jgi:hypothetical protein